MEHDILFSDFHPEGHRPRRVDKKSFYLLFFFSRVLVGRKKKKHKQQQRTPYARQRPGRTVGYGKNRRENEQRKGGRKKITGRDKSHKSPRAIHCVNVRTSIRSVCRAERVEMCAYTKTRRQWRRGVEENSGGDTSSFRYKVNI